MAFFIAMVAMTQAQSPFVGQATDTLSGPPDSPMRMPTDVAVCDNGSVYVADGVRGRVILFSVDGEFKDFIHEVGQHTLVNPVALLCDGDLLWITDPEAGKIVVREPSGQITREIDVSNWGDSGKADITDLALSPDREQIWMADNDGHRLLRMPIDGTVPIAFGGPGVSLGQFQYPVSLAVDPDGSVYLAEALGARVQVLTDLGVPSGRIGRYGVGPGELYRPRGIAIDKANRVWVADGVLGVVQVFSSLGRYLDVLRDPDGAPIQFRQPAGITFDVAGRLCVVELGANRVVRLSLTIDESFRPARDRNQQVRRQQEATSCTACHLEWMSAFESQDSETWIARPAQIPEEPYVASSEACLSCHDGTIVDSRQRVWSEHGHTTGVTPPDTMTIPGNLPLVRGAIECRTCHSAHAEGPPTSDLANAVFLRIDNTSGALCQACHHQMAPTDLERDHPMGPSDWPIPDRLLAAHGRSGTTATSITCQTCHTPHGASQNDLLLEVARPFDLCTSCHATEELVYSQPVEPYLADEMIIHFATHESEDANDCRTCHRMHAAQSDQYLLQETLEGSRLCIECHEESAVLLGSAHDLERTCPEHLNAMGQSPQEAGPCSTCHAVHSNALEPVVAPLDPEGLCSGCHQPDACPDVGLAQPLAHPSMANRELMNKLLVATGRATRKHLEAVNITCLSCHDPHMAGHGDMSRGGYEQICIACHESGTSIAASLHAPSFINQPGESEAACQPCHFVHLPSAQQFDPAIMTAEKALQAANCEDCHRSGGIASAVKMTVHPRVHLANMNSADQPGYMPIATGTDHAPQIDCKTCHLPHGRPAGGGYDPLDWLDKSLTQRRAARPMLRPYVTPNLCSSCHGMEGLSLFLNYHPR
jgi:predicted CXXCH cytochrome family protein